MELPGPWVAAEADDDIRRNGIGLDCDDRATGEMDRDRRCRGTGRHHPKFATSNGPLMYRTRFTAPTPADGRRRWVTLDGIFYQGDVWLDGAYLGDPEGYFFPHSFDITDLSRFDDEHVLADRGHLRAAGAIRDRAATSPACSSSRSGSTSRTTRAGCGARSGSTTPARCASIGCVCCAAMPTPVAPTCASTARLDSDAQRPIVIRTMIDGHPHAETTQVVASGQNDLEWSIDLPTRRCGGRVRSATNR